MSSNSSSTFFRTLLGADPKDPIAMKEKWKNQRKNPQSSALIESLRSAAIPQGVDAWEFVCRCGFTNTVQRADPRVIEAEEYCHRCGMTLRFASVSTPVKMMRPVGERLKEASLRNQRNAFRAACEQQEEKTPFWMIHPDKLETSY